MTIPLRRLLPGGIESFRQWLGSKLDPSLRPSLEDGTTTAVVVPAAMVDQNLTFVTRFEMGTYLATQLAPLKSSKAIEDSGLWAWLSLAYIDQLCPVIKGQRVIGAEDRFIPNTSDNRRRIRHLVRTNYELAERHGEASRLLLDRRLHIHGEDTEQLLGRRQLALNTAVFQALTILYLRPSGVIRGARGQGGGTYRRFGKVAWQFDLTYDLQSMTPQEIMSLLPKEFSRYANA